MPTTVQNQELDRIVGRNLFGQDGEKIGKVRQVYLDDRTGQPEWVTVTTGWFADRVSFVPLRQMTLDGDTAHTPFARDMVKEAPTAANHGKLSPAEEQRLYSHYGLTRGEDERPVSRERIETGKARLRRWVEAR